MTKADQNLMVIQNFILHVTHCSNESDGVDTFSRIFKTPMKFTPKELYKMAIEYIEEDHVDGRDNEENNIEL
jgi:hypothetical protein